MQTTTLPIQVSGAGPANAPQRQSSGSDAGEFGLTLAREMAQRSAQPAAPQQAPKAQQPQQAAKPQQQDNNAKADEAPDTAQASAQDPAKADAAADGGKTKVADDKDASGDKDQDAQAAASSPAADMLALMASFSHLTKASPSTAKASADTLQGTAGKVDATQASLKRLAMLDDTAAGHAKPAAQALGDNQQAASAGTAHKDAAGEGIDLRAALAGETQARTKSASDFDNHARDIAAKLEAIVPAAAPVQAQMQAAAVEAVQTGAAAGDHLSARVGTTAWDNQVGQKIVWMVGSEEQTASLTLNPPDLGPMQVVLSVTGDQASVAFSANHEEVRHALESALPRLREMMSESGIALGSATVSTGMPDQRQAQGGHGSGSGSRGSGGFGGDASNAVDAAPQVATRTTVLGDGLVNTFA